MRKSIRHGFTLIEILIVVVIMAILAATIIPQFTGSTQDAQISTTQFNLNTLRAQIELFKAHHNGTPPAVGTVGGVQVINDLLIQTNDSNGNPVGPYLSRMPIQNISNPATFAVSTAATPDGAGGGWWYNTTTGEIRINDTGYSTE